MQFPSPCITRIVTVYRQWEFLRTWIANPGIRQPGVKWLFVNDSPSVKAPQDIRAALEELQAQVVTSLFNAGRSNARNLGVAHIDTPYLEHVDGDDIPLPLNDAILHLLAQDTADLILSPVVEWPVGTNPPDLKTDYPGVIASVWGPLFPDQPPVDVRPAATVWRTATFRKLGGYDARFESGEDLHLVWKCLHAGFAVERTGFAKQVYQAKPKAWLGDSLYCRGHVLFLEWLVAEGKATRQQVDEWHPRLLTQQAWHTLRKLVCERQALGAYLLRNLHKLRRW